MVSHSPFDTDAVGVAQCGRDSRKHRYSGVLDLEVVAPEHIENDSLHFLRKNTKRKARICYMLCLHAEPIAEFQCGCLHGYNLFLRQ